jgi:hypothetical protein
MRRYELTPIQQVLQAVHEIRQSNTYEASPMLFIQWFSNNIDRLLYEEKYLIVDTYDAAIDPESSKQLDFKKTAGQVFFENNFINL